MACRSWLGPAFGDEDVRARALGATAWARDAHDAVTAMEGLPAISAALLTGDRPIPETAAWVADLIRSRNGDEMMLSELTGVLSVVLREYPQASKLVADHFAESF